ncbi:MAG: hypothetical protein ACU84Q_07960 [Gammaproteobacteria bacterium]
MSLVNIMRVGGLIGPIALLIVVGGPSAVADEGQPSSAWRAFEFQGKTVSVRPENNADGTSSYEVLAEEGGLVMARLLVNRNGVLSDAWKTDLDGDGSPELVVAIGQLNGTNQGAVDIHEWDGYKFDSVRVPLDIAAEKNSYDGHDQFKLTAGKLRREFPRFIEAEGNRVPSGDKASYHFDMQSSRWIAE